MDEFRERVAALCHKQWTGWMEYLFEKCTHNADGTSTIPTWAVERWERQADTPYADLSEEEKESDRKEADRFIALFSDELDRIAEQVDVDALLSDVLDERIER